MENRRLHAVGSSPPAEEVVLATPGSLGQADAVTGYKDSATLIDHAKPCLAARDKRAHFSRAP